LHELLRDSDELSGFLRQYRIEPAIIILLTRIKKLVQGGGEFFRQETRSDALRIEESQHPSMSARRFAEGLEQSEHSIKRGVVGPIDNRSGTATSSKEVPAILQGFGSLLHTPGHEYTHMLEVHTGIPSALTASMSKEDCSGPCSASSRVMTTV
jgi:hypothetical protein